MLSCSPPVARASASRFLSLHLKSYSMRIPSRLSSKRDDKLQNIAACLRCQLRYPDHSGIEPRRDQRELRTSPIEPSPRTVASKENTDLNDCVPVAHTRISSARYLDGRQERVEITTPPSMSPWLVFARSRSQASCSFNDSSQIRLSFVSRTSTSSDGL